MTESTARCDKSVISDKSLWSHKSLMSQLNTAERYVDGRELAGIMGVSIRTIRRWTSEGMPCERWGMSRTVRFLPSEAIRWASTRLVTPPNPTPKTLDSACDPSRVVSVFTSSADAPTSTPSPTPSKEHLDG